ncbi:MAG: hypothetical protein A2428_04145 [Bdellovibrionales bacterium RIFOXYC1_FULL_54_43]|nr:MAG: hypothetical protein A2428_04145 [Bdellovibrionales bacterium RIFOXYC1_FULL_54_43]OFZ82941.1 MAG: hypothetical protein A2603_10970 [Bdellovibrionales bacterium RIFOXYD1_FULL_55_31]
MTERVIPLFVCLGISVHLESAKLFSGIPFSLVPYNFFHIHVKLTQEFNQASRKEIEDVWSEWFTRAALCAKEKQWMTSKEN